MRRHHKLLAFAIFAKVILITYFFGLRINEVVVQSLVTFFSIIFGFYITFIAILYNAGCTKVLYEEVDVKLQKSYLYILKTYISISGRYCIASIIVMIIYLCLCKNNDYGVLSFESINLLYIERKLNFNLLLDSLVLGISSVNVVFIWLMLDTALTGLIREANHKSD